METARLVTLTLLYVNMLKEFCFIGFCFLLKRGTYTFLFLFGSLFFFFVWRNQPFQLGSLKKERKKVMDSNTIRSLEPYIWSRLHAKTILLFFFQMKIA